MELEKKAVAAERSAFAKETVKQRAMAARLSAKKKGMRGSGVRGAIGALGELGRTSGKFFDKEIAQFDKGKKKKGRGPHSVFGDF